VGLADLDESLGRANLVLALLGRRHHLPDALAGLLALLELRLALEAARAEGAVRSQWPRRRVTTDPQAGESARSEAKRRTSDRHALVDDHRKDLALEGAVDDRPFALATVSAGRAETKNAPGR